MPPHVSAYTYGDLLPADFAARRLSQDVLAGLTSSPKWLPPTWLYDKVGSELFEEITRLPEYYPTGCERQILESHAADAVDISGCNGLVELGSGSSLKTHLLLDALTRSSGRRGTRPWYLATDVSEDALREACARVATLYPDLSVAAVRADFSSQLHDTLGQVERDGPRLIAFLGGTIGNFEPGPRSAFLAALRRAMAPGDHLLLGADLAKSPTVLLPAYDDSAGVTAAFNLNVLEVLNQALDGDFDGARFRHRAVWDADNEWIEMRLQAKLTHTVTLAKLGLRLQFAAHEEVRTEVSAKFRQERLTLELVEAGFAPVRWWTDPRDLFSLSLWSAR